ncbi:MAG: hypothetical protein ABFS05_08835 [Bacteroidota bacterium]
MTSKNEHQEGFFKKLLKQGSVEKAPGGFADKVMAAIEAEAATVKAKWWMQSNAWIWGSVVFAFACLVVMVFMIDFSFMGNIVKGVELDGSMISHFVNYLGSGFVSLFSGFNISSITISIVVAILALFVVDRLLRRKPNVEIGMI